MANEGYATRLVPARPTLDTRIAEVGFEMSAQWGWHATDYRIRFAEAKHISTARLLNGEQT